MPRRQRTRSLTGRLMILAVIFLAVPAALYYNFRRAEAEQRELLQQAVLEQGRLVATALEPVLTLGDPSPLVALPRELERFADTNRRIRILLRPADQSGVDSFFYVAAQPPVPAGLLEAERDELVRQGVLDNVAQTCIGNMALADRYRDSEGREEILTSLTPVRTANGCWVVVLSHPVESLVGSSLGRPYWMRPEVRIAAAIYLVLAGLTFGVFWSVRRGVVRLRDTAYALRTGSGDQSFSERNQISELVGVATEFDRLIGGLKDTATRIRRAAQDNAHAFKTPIAIIRQSLEPLKRTVVPGDSRGRRALAVLEMSIERLDHLVATARRMDETVADLVYPPRESVDLSRLLWRMVVAYGAMAEGRGLRLTRVIDDGVNVLASVELLETVIENILDNAFGISRAGSEVVVELRRHEGVAELIIRDHGPGVADDDLERIFERNYSARADLGAADPDQAAHAGIGLWVVRRNVEAVGGEVWAEAAEGGGLAVRLRLPLAG